MRGTIEIGGYETEAAVEEIDGVLTVEMLPTCESMDIIIGAVPGAVARVRTADGAEYEGRVVITDPDDYVTQVEAY